MVNTSPCGGGNKKSAYEHVPWPGLQILRFSHHNTTEITAVGIKWAKEKKCNKKIFISLYTQSGSAHIEQWLSEITDMRCRPVKRFIYIHIFKNMTCPKFCVAPMSVANPPMDSKNLLPKAVIWTDRQWASTFIVQYLNSLCYKHCTIFRMSTAHFKTVSVFIKQIGII